jgi:hypothetical protein
MLITPTGERYNTPQIANSLIIHDLPGGFNIFARIDVLT